MASELDVSLDDIIKSKKTSSRGGRGAGRGTARGSGNLGPQRRNTKRSGFRAAPYASAQQAPAAHNGAWQHDMFSGAVTTANPGLSGRGGAIETGTKLYVSNLDYGVSNEDIKELFSEIGDLKRCSIHYDKSGRSKGSAEVVFARKADGLAAVSRYNNVQLDGKPMKIEIIGTNVSAPAASISRIGPPAAAIPAVPAYAGRPYAAFPRGGGGARGSRGGRRGGRGGRGGRGRGGDKPMKTQEELDAELDQYHATKSQGEAMQD